MRGDAIGEVYGLLVDLEVLEDEERSQRPMIIEFGVSPAISARPHHLGLTISSSRESIA